MDLINGSMWIVDVEGSGGTPPEIVQIALTEICSLRLGERMWEWLIQPSAPITPIATRIHGISNDDVESAPTISDIADDIMMWTDGSVVIGHNVRVDVDIIKRSIPEWKPAMAIDTLRIAKIVLPGMESYSLQKLGLRLGCSDEAARISGKTHHSALYDSVLTALLFIEFLSRVPEKDRLSLVMDADILSTRQGELF
ncbi:3'-5' exonuclease [Azospirillum sp.]|uniref:3'-5' exonuclease n=1 Tax=Azospirillum sp. TaxID=34012 RepID=UPI002D666CD6|nr:3'-5' exonuclease [Azospirillum sp.]HYF87474.1 3'-5' exonuclease [Azospirillum sp.]